MTRTVYHTVPARVVKKAFGAEPHVGTLVIARKTSFGSQSERGLKTRETLSSVVCTLALRCDDPVARLSSVFDALARDPEADVAALLWGKAEA